MRIRWGIILIGILSLFFWGCTTFKTIDLGYSAAKVPTPLPGSVKIAVIPFEDLTLNGQENPNWVGQASLYGIKLYSPNSISYLVTRGVKNEMAAYGYQLSTDEIYSIQINRNDIRTLLKKAPLYPGRLFGGRDDLSFFCPANWPIYCRGGNRGLPDPSSRRGDCLEQKNRPSGSPGPLYPGGFFSGKRADFKQPVAKDLDRALPKF